MIKILFEQISDETVCLFLSLWLRSRVPKTEFDRPCLETDAAIIPLQLLVNPHRPLKKMNESQENHDESLFTCRHKSKKLWNSGDMSSHETIAGRPYLAIKKIALAGAWKNQNHSSVCLNSFNKLPRLDMVELPPDTQWPWYPKTKCQLSYCTVSSSRSPAPSSRVYLPW